MDDNQKQKPVTDDQNQTPQTEEDLSNPPASEKPEEVVQTTSNVADDQNSKSVKEGEVEDGESSPLSEASQIPSDSTSSDVLEQNLTGSEQSEEAELENQSQTSEPTKDETSTDEESQARDDATDPTVDEPSDDTPLDDGTPRPRWYVIHTYSGHENRVAETLKQRVASEHLNDKITDVLVPTQDKIEIKGGKKETVKEKIFPGYILVKMILDDDSWLVVRTTQGVTSFVGMGNKPTPIPEYEVKTIVNFMSEGQQPTYKTVYIEGDTVKIVDGPFAEFIGKVDTVDKERGKVKVLVSIFGRETPVELDFLQIQKL